MCGRCVLTPSCLHLHSSSSSTPYYRGGEATLGMNHAGVLAATCCVLALVQPVQAFVAVPPSVNTRRPGGLSSLDVRQQAGSARPHSGAEAGVRGSRNCRRRQRHVSDERRQWRTLIRPRVARSSWKCRERRNPSLLYIACARGGRSLLITYTTATCSVCNPHVNTLYQ